MLTIEDKEEKNEDEQQEEKNEIITPLPIMIPNPLPNVV